LSGQKNLKKNEVVFREGDTSDCMYVIKSGKIAITKVKGSSEIVLAELGAGDMLGEMAFFDNKPRSAGARAMADSVVIELPFKALNAQFATFPEWIKAIVRTVTTHLRNANQKIKQLEKTTEDETQMFPPHMVTRLVAILGFMAKTYGEPVGKPPETAVVVPPNRLRNFTIQIFQAPTAKMTAMQEILQAFGHMKIEDLGEGRQKLTVFNPDFLLNFVDFYNDWLFKSEDKRVSVEEKELKAMRAITFYGKKMPVNDKGEVKVDLTEIQNSAMRDLSTQFSVDDVNTLGEKKITSEKMSEEGGRLSLKFNLQEVSSLLPYWELIHASRKALR
jgi:CRP-like cAMP-binding protein